MSAYDMRKLEEAPVDPQKAAFPGLNCVFGERNNSMLLPPEFSDKPTLSCDSGFCSIRLEEAPVDSPRAASSGLHCVSMENNNSMPLPPEFSDGAASSDSGTRLRMASVDPQRAASAGLISASMKRNNSMPLPPEFSDGATRTDSGGVLLKTKRLKMVPVDTQRAASPGLDYVSICSNSSMPLPPEFSDGYRLRSDSGVNCGEEPRVTSKLQKYARELTLDPNTANTLLVLSKENRKVTSVKRRQSYADHPDRFDGYLQVLCKESLTGRCYWEAQWSGSYAEISVCYKGIKRKGWSYDSWFGHNKKSWSLRCSDHSFTVWHNDKAKVLSVPPASSRTVGVFVDKSSGSLSFYSVSETQKLIHLHTFNTTFTDRLYAGFIVSPKSSVSLRHNKYTDKIRKNMDTHTNTYTAPTQTCSLHTRTYTHKPIRLASTPKHNAHTYTHQTHMHRHKLHTLHSTYTNSTLYTLLCSVATLCCLFLLCILCFLSYLLFFFINTLQNSREIFFRNC